MPSTTSRLGRRRVQLVLYDDPLSELADAADADELCRLLLESAWGWGSSTGHMEAVDLLRSVRGTGELGDGFLALLLCTCSRWDRVTAKLIVALEESDLLACGDLDSLAESFLTDEVIVECPVSWLRPDLVGLEFGDDAGDVVFTVAGEIPITERRRPEPPLRRWAAARALRADPGLLDALLDDAGSLPPAHRELYSRDCSTAPPDWRRRIDAGWSSGACAPGPRRHAGARSTCWVTSTGPTRRGAGPSGTATSTSGNGVPGFRSLSFPRSHRRGWSPEHSCGFLLRGGGRSAMSWWDEHRLPGRERGGGS